jgi:hypothetical protein
MYDQALWLLPVSREPTERIHPRWGRCIRTGPRWCRFSDVRLVADAARRGGRQAHPASSARAWSCNPWARADRIAWPAVPRQRFFEPFWRSDGGHTYTPIQRATRPPSFACRVACGTGPVRSPPGTLRPHRQSGPDPTGPSLVCSLYGFLNRSDPPSIASTTSLTSPGGWMPSRALRWATGPIRPAPEGQGRTSPGHEPPAAELPGLSPRGRGAPEAGLPACAAQPPACAHPAPCAWPAWPAPQPGQRRRWWGRLGRCCLPSPTPAVLAAQLDATTPA